MMTDTFNHDRKTILANQIFSYQKLFQNLRRGEDLWNKSGSALFYCYKEGLGESVSFPFRSKE